VRDILHAQNAVIDASIQEQKELLDTIEYRKVQRVLSQKELGFVIQPTTKVEVRPPNVKYCLQAKKNELNAEI